MYQYITNIFIQKKTCYYKMIYVVRNFYLSLISLKVETEITVLSFIEIHRVFFFTNDRLIVKVILLAQGLEYM